MEGSIKGQNCSNWSLRACLKTSNLAETLDKARGVREIGELIYTPMTNIQKTIESQASLKYAAVVM